MGISNLFKEMFPDSEVAKHFTCGQTKCAHFVCLGIAPYFTSLLYNLLRIVENYTLLIDETLNKSLQSKQMGILVRFWNSNAQKVETRYLTSVFMGHSTAEDTLKAFNDATKKLDLRKVIQIPMVGPAVNWKFFHMIQEHIGDELLNIGSCGLHILNNAFKVGNRATEWNLDSLFTALYWLFKDSPAHEVY
ncbi:hypothetical protein AVEN_263358-1 [Araneus ventricosus]|uniref:Uncharacterized protein n=1 Tax=Araneus ventricosus TaxID=182803 RepID=A0A4Y2D2X0_ARAVE|nr:hypothetical protein AVEN_263358-1 [Araneus ventricosus]